MTTRYFIKIENNAGLYRAEIYDNRPEPVHIAENISLSPEAKVIIKGKPFSLAQLLNALFQYQESDLKLAYDERGQLELGQYLFRQIFGNADAALKKSLTNENLKTELRIVSHDEHICRLPWVLLADENANFLSALNCTVSLSASMDSHNIELPPSPKILIVMPQPIHEKYPETKAESHLERLEDLLSSADHRHYQGHNLRVVFTYEDFEREIKLFQPHILYYYGHGIGDTDSSRLCFAFGKERKLREILIADISYFLRNLPQRPIIAYLNCCQGDTGGFLGAGMQLRNFIPVVISNRTKAKIEAAKDQAEAFWRCVLIDGLAPLQAMNEMRHYQKGEHLTLADARWMTPVLHCGYNRWTSNPPEKIGHHIRDPFWHLKIDRVKQFGPVYYLTMQMLQEQKPRSLAYLWYGAEGQGVDLFHHRLKVELQERLRDVNVSEIQPEWPIQMTNPHQCFEDMMTEAFDVQSLSHIPGRIREYSRSVSGRQTLVYVRHQPLRTTKIITLDRLKTYLEWWDCCFTRILEGQAFGLLGISFVVSDTKAFHKTLVEKKRINALQLQHTVFHLLDEMEHLTKKDLLDFLKAHNIPLPQKLQDKVLDKILSETGGHYEMTLEALKDVVSRGWDLSDKEENSQTVDDEEEDFGVDDK